VPANPVFGPRAHEPRRRENFRPAVTESTSPPLSAMTASGI